jgi:hypothetical protein
MVRLFMFSKQFKNFPDFTISSGRIAPWANNVFKHLKCLSDYFDSWFFLAIGED